VAYIYIYIFLAEPPLVQQLVRSKRQLPKKKKWIRDNYSDILLKLKKTTRGEGKETYIEKKRLINGE